MVEIWLDIKGFEGLYQVSNLGRVKSLVNNHLTKREKILKQCIDNRGYFIVNLYKYGKPITKRVHRLVAEAFLPNPENLPCINHKDETRTNNCVSNLEFCDYRYNNTYGTRIKRSVEKYSKKVICVETNIIYQSAMEAQRKTGIYQQNISSCCKGKLKRAGKFHWQYV